MYKSATLGSDSWRKVKKVHDFTPKSYETSSSCEISQRYDDSNIIILHCRTKMFISYNGILGNYTMNKLDIPRPGDGSRNYTFGGSSTYREDNDLYLVTSRQTRLDEGKNIRSAYIYKLNSTWTGLDKDTPALTWVWNHRESPMVTKRDSMYYVFASRTKKWDQSTTHYRMAGSLEGLADAIDSEVVMHPANTPEIKSMKSQFCFFQEFGEGKWMFGGRRHPLEAPGIHPLKYGKHVMAPATFIDGVPHVYWKSSFDWTTYDYTNPNNDSYENLGRDRCVDSTHRIWLSKKSRTHVYCEWLTATTFRRRCNKHAQLRTECPVSCNVNGCR